ncbi:MAG: low affinity potassium transporter [Vezdaea aestivalis]|nr:MAG: low affinity potassium transporter [Vezdaea aestivalis]
MWSLVTPILRKAREAFTPDLYILGVTIAGSIMIYPAGGVKYIDALFFASGSATQSGLNTVDVNKINTFQQAVIFTTPFFATPIFINTVVVFVRLYWFERRFRSVTQAARENRRTRTKSRSKVDNQPEEDLDKAERGVNGRSIVVLLNDKKKDPHLNGHSPATDSEKSRHEANAGPHGISGDLHSPTSPFTRDIMFADEVRSPAESPHDIRMPQQRSTEQHIAFVEQQRNPSNRETLRIPGPRDFDKGDTPHDVGNGHHFRQKDTNPLYGHDSSAIEDDEKLNLDDHPIKKSITIDDVLHPQGHHRTGTGLSAFRFRTKDGQDDGTSSVVGRTLSGLRQRARSNTFVTSKTQRTVDQTPYLSWQPTIGRNSAFVDLTEEQREELGGIEYRSLKTLAYILCGYYIGFHVLGVVCFTPFIMRSAKYGGIIDADGVGRPWWAFFSSATMFNDVGFTLTPDSFISFYDSKLVLLLGSFLIVIGNTGFPCMLRFIIWILSKLVPSNSGIFEELRFLLDHPRRCFTLLFPSQATWVLFSILVLLNGIDLIFYIILDLNNPAVSSFPVHIRLLDGWFQAVSTRTAGTSVVNLALLHPGIQVSYLIMMYISVFPIAISVRRTNVYEEKSLGMYSSVSEQNEDEKEPSYVGAHLRKQLSFDLWYIFLGLFVIACIEGKHVENTNEYAFTLFSILFEIVSAYGTVGLSLGYPNLNCSFSGALSTTSKLVIIAMQIRGRHRGLPYELDRAILLPSENLHAKEDRDAKERLARRNSAINLSRSRRASEAGSSRPPPGLFRPSTARSNVSAAVSGEKRE